MQTISRFNGPHGKILCFKKKVCGHIASEIQTT
jgi:hypothetical protein